MKKPPKRLLPVNRQLEIDGAEVSKVVRAITSDTTSEQALEAALVAITPSLLDSMLVTALASLTNMLRNLPAKDKARILRLLWELLAPDTSEVVRND